MTNRELLPLLREIKQQKMARFNEVFSVFERLLACFRYRLGDDDAMQELTLFLLELIYAIDTDQFAEDDSEALKRYIAVALRNRYILLSKQRDLYRRMSNELNDGFGESPLSEEQIVLKHALRRLPEKQRLVIVYRYYYGYSIEEIADMLAITRQGANQLKNRGLATLKKYCAFE